MQWGAAAESLYPFLISIQILGSRGGARKGRTCVSAHADTRMLEATRSQGMTSYTLCGSWHVKRAMPARVHGSLAGLRTECCQAQAVSFRRAA